MEPPSNKRKNHGDGNREDIPRAPKRYHPANHTTHASDNAQKNHQRCSPLIAGNIKRVDAVPHHENPWSVVEDQVEDRYVFDLSDIEDEYDRLQDPDADWSEEHSACVLADIGTAPVSDHGQDEALSAHLVMGVPCGLPSGDKFERALRSVIEPLLDWAQRMSFSCFKKEKPITWTFFLGLRRYDVGTLMTNVLSVTLPEVKALFEKDKWMVEDLLSLPLLRYADERMVNYCHLVPGDFPDQEFGCDGYVGFTGHGGVRRTGHELSIRSGVRNLHYDRARLPGALSRFVLLAVFGSGVDAANAQLAEGLFMIIFDTFQWHGRVYAGSTLSTFELAEVIRDPVLYSPGWKGLNSCWSLKQGIPGTNLQRASECSNFPCKNTVLRRQVLSHMESHPITMTRRFLLREDDPLAGFICSYCYGYRDRDSKHNLPKLEYVANAQAQQKRLEDKKAGVQVHCGHCHTPQNPNAPDYTWSDEYQMILCRACRASKYATGELRSLGAKKRQEDKDFLVQNVGRCQNGNCPVTENINRLKYGKPLLYWKEVSLRCGGCYAYLVRYGNDRNGPEKLAPTPDELAKLQKRPPYVCVKCHAVEGFPGVSKTWHRSEGSNICRPCYRVPGGRDPQLQRLQETQAEVNILRKLGHEITCPCGTREGKDGTKKFKVHKLLLLPLCRNCREKDSRAARAPEDGKNQQL
ncbi:hypothetical protein CBS147333_533 [Penicillium roqueforti]|nr:hypothetical protein CBS147333_533 [Penicillium roqueforti]KAI3277505.1 hypothetical protein CBS147308_807 [Penicillium roqueforti]KAI3299206.1 hypothetical protein DTO003C3_337 [Penicillium roqueforti]